MSEDKLWRFMLPKEHELIPNEQVVLLREVDAEKGGIFGPPKDFAVQGRIIAAGVNERHWATNLCEVVAMGEKVHEMPGWNSDHPLKVGQWVIHRGASPFFFLGQKYLVCLPEFVVAIAKRPEIPAEKLYEIWSRRGEPLERGENVVEMTKKKGE